MYDVIIIGAGPTGSSAAKELADNGYRVLIIEKFKMPRNKSCSGVLIKKSMDLVKKYFHEDIPKATTCTPIENKGMVFTSDDGREYRYEQDGLNIWRSVFDHWLAEKAVEAGAELRDETTALSCEEQNDCVMVRLKCKSEYVEKAKAVIACDGVVCSVKRRLCNTPKSYIITYQTFNKGTIDLDHHYFYAYLQPQFSEYDAWFNVKDDYLIFGVAVKDAGKIKHYYSEFIAFMELQHNAKIEKQVNSEKWIMPHIIPGCPIYYGEGRVLFAGEAAGFLNPMGEGISAGLESGYAAARAIIQVSLHTQFDTQAIHTAYENNVATLKNYMERQWSFVGGIAAKFNAHKMQW